MQAAHPLQIYGWCPYCRESSGGPTCPSCDCTVHEVRTTGARGDGDMPPHAVELEVSTQINRSRGRYFIRLLLGTSVTLSETFDDDEIEVAERRVGSVLIPVSNSNTRKSLHLLAVRMWRRRHGGGGRRV